MIKKTKQAIRRKKTSTKQNPGIRLVPVSVETGNVALGDDVAEGLHDFLEQAYLDWEQDHGLRHFNIRRATKKDEAKILQFLETGASLGKLSRNTDYLINRHVGVPKGAWVNPPKFKLVHALRLMIVLGELWIDGDSFRSYNMQFLERYRKLCSNAFGLRELDIAMSSFFKGKEKGRVAIAYLEQSWFKFCDWEDEAIWPIFVEHPVILHCAMFDGEQHHRQNAMRVLAMMPELPGEEYKDRLWDLALGGSKSERLLAQSALHTVANKGESIARFLQDTASGIKIAAAEWLGRSGDKAVVGALKRAYGKEKNAAVKTVFMQALRSLNADVGEFISRESLLKEAQLELERKLPEGMEWVQLKNLPVQYWSDTGKKVDPRIVQCWIIKSIRQKSAESGAILKQTLQLCRKKNVVDLARYVLAEWIAYDTIPAISASAAQRAAREEANEEWKRYGAYEEFQKRFRSKEVLRKSILDRYARQLAGSAIGQKGMLAIVSAVGDDLCAKLCTEYIHKWYGTRPAQCRVLIDVLASMDSPLALQSLLSIASRFRTKGLKKQAQKHVNSVAETRGWTVDELADHTIPFAGFERALDKDGNPVGHEAVLLLDYGSRQFQVRLNDDLEAVICKKGSQKELKSLPESNSHDDQELVAIAKQSLLNAKKTVKDVIKKQSQRLYEAMCTQRSWRFSDWRRVLLQHPIVGRLCVRLVWSAEARKNGSKEKKVQHFRPLEDGTLSNVEDEEVFLAEDAIISLAHAIGISKTVQEKWKKHFEDYDVEPLFTQLGEVYTLPGKEMNSSSIREFEGYVISRGKLHSEALKLGYERGENMKGVVYYYCKSFQSAGLRSIIDFTGNAFSRDEPVVIISLNFVKLDQSDAWPVHKLPLNQIPPILLSECYQHIKQIANRGIGFDKNWRERTDKYWFWWD